MYLVDTSVWIDYLRDRQNSATKILSTILDKKIPFGITSFIYQEILQGAPSHDAFEELKSYFSTQKFFHPKHENETFQSAAYLYFLCRRKGITIRSSIDCLIAQIAIEHKLVLLHHDQDYEKISKVIPELELAA